MPFQWKASTDNRIGTDKTTLHSFGDVYEGLFKKLRTLQSPTLMEIGVLSGASVVNLAIEFPRSTIYAIDIDLRNVLYRDEIPSWTTVHWIQMDATVPRMPSHPRIPNDETFDLIIDDGSHQSEDIVATFVLWANRLNDGGFYVIEDLTETVVQDIFGLLQKIAKKHSIELVLHDLRSVKGRWDDILIVGERRPNYRNVRGDNGGV